MIRTHAFLPHALNVGSPVVIEIETDEADDDAADAAALDLLKATVPDADAWYQAECWETGRKWDASKDPDRRTVKDRRAVLAPMDPDPDGDFLRTE